MLKKQSIVLAHPALYEHDHDLKFYGEYASVPPQPRHSRPRVVDNFFGSGARWIAYAASPAQAEKKEWLLVWTTTNLFHNWNQFTDEEIDAIEAEFAPHVTELRLLLAEDVVGLHSKRAVVYIQDYMRELGFPTTDQESLPSVSQVWNMFQEERQRFEDSTAQWQKQVAALQALDQLFIVS